MRVDTSAREADRRALDLLCAEIRELSDDDLSEATPCVGWDVADLIRHMTIEHVAICGGDVDESADPRPQFSRVASLWTAFFDSAPAEVEVPKLNSVLPTDIVLATHAADMLVHRWDVAAALGRAISTPIDLVEYAHGVADVVTAQGSPLVGPGAAYEVALPEVDGDEPFDALLRRFGRDPRWCRRDVRA